MKVELRMKCLLVGLVHLYLLFAVIGRFVERMGAVECGCGDDCWCKRPGLSLFRWVFLKWDGYRTQAERRPLHNPE
jgi:hypothetical protein